jgi:hypothetical protein
MTLARGFICIFRQIAHHLEELLGLADEQAASLEACDRLLRTKDFCRDRDRANDRNRRELAAEERASSGMIRLVWKSSTPNGGGAGKGGTLRFGNTRVPSVRGGEVLTALPALSCQVWKWEVSVGPMLSRIRKTTGLVTFRASVG